MGSAAGHSSDPTDGTVATAHTAPAPWRTTLVANQDNPDNQGSPASLGSPPSQDSPEGYASHGSQAHLDDLARRACSSDGQAVEQLLTEVHAMAHQYAGARLCRFPGARHGIADVAQEVCEAVLHSLPRYADRGRPFAAFVYSICSRKVADYQRHTLAGPYSTAEVPDGVDGGVGPEERVIARADAALAAHLVAQLPGPQRELITLRVSFGLSAEETGRLLGMTPGAVRVAQHRALGKLRVLHAAHARECVA